MAGRPPKPVELLKFEKKSHRTKAELEHREKAEKDLLSGQPMKAWPEVWNDPVARKEFTRVRNLLKKINHNDGLHEAVINRYCILVKECKRSEEYIEQFSQELSELAEMKSKGEIDYADYLKERGRTQDRMIAWDRKLMEKRKMLLQIEKENIMTILAALRAIPKTPAEDKPSPMAEYLRKKREG